jgi:hypothetical protein
LFVANDPSAIVGRPDQRDSPEVTLQLDGRRLAKPPNFIDPTLATHPAATAKGKSTAA